MKLLFDYINSIVWGKKCVEFDMFDVIYFVVFFI